MSFHSSETAPIKLTNDKSSNSIVIRSDGGDINDEEIKELIERIGSESILFDMANYVSDDIPFDELLKLIELSEETSTTLASTSIGLENVEELNSLPSLNWIVFRSQDEEYSIYLDDLGNGLSEITAFGHGIWSECLDRCKKEVSF